MAVGWGSSQTPGRPLKLWSKARGGVPNGIQKETQRGPQTEDQNSYRKMGCVSTVKCLEAATLSQDAARPDGREPTKATGDNANGLQGHQPWFISGRSTGDGAVPSHHWPSALGLKQDAKAAS